MHYLNAMDAAFVRMDTKRTPMHVAGLMVFCLPAEAAKDYLRELFAYMCSQPVVRAPFNLRLAHNRLSPLAPQWEKASDIEIEYHLRHSALPYPGGERELGILVSRLHSQPLDMQRPLWECHLIEGLENRRFAIYLKVHHAALDGLSALKMMNQWLSTEPEEQTKPGPWAIPAPARHAEHKPAPANLIHYGVHLVQENLDGARELTKALRGMMRTKAHPQGSIGLPTDIPRTVFNGRISQHRRLATQLFDLKHLKALTRQLGCTVNDLCLTLCGGAIRRYLMEYDALPDRTLAASVPIGLPHPDGGDGNRVAGFQCPIATNVADPIERLRRIRAVTADTKEQMKNLSDAALLQFSLLGISPLLLGQVSGLALRIPPLFNLTISNVIGSDKPLYLRGAELEGLYPMSVLFDGHTLNITVVGYSGRLCVGVTGCRENNPNLQKLAVYIGAELAELEAAMAIGTRRGTAKPGSRKTPARRRGRSTATES